MDADGPDYKPKEIIEAVKQRAGYDELGGKEKADLGSLLELVFRKLNQLK